ncbi:MAG: hypothetical protein Salg2KO_09290 [Salibacteraceae bacterium]
MTFIFDSHSFKSQDMIKNILIPILALLPIIGFSQFTYEYNGDSVIVGHLGEDVEFDLDVTNLDENNVQNIKWRIVSNDMPNPAWNDYVCDILCYDAEKRSNVFPMNADTIFPIIHHISMNEVHGMGWSELCFFDPNDSANTIECRTLTAYSTPMLLEDTIPVQGEDVVVVTGTAYNDNNGSFSEHDDYSIIDGKKYQFLVLDGDIYFYQDGTFVPYDGVVEYEIDGVTYYIVDGVAFTKDGNDYTSAGDFETEDDYIIIDGDTFEMFGSMWVPLGTDEIALRSEYLKQNSPNPFSGFTLVEYAIDGNQATLQIRDLTGKLVRQEVLTTTQGRVEIGADLESGLYFYSLLSDGQVVDTKRMQVID